VIGECENGREALRKAEELQPDVMVLDISLPLLNGLEVTRQIMKRNPEIKILILTMHTSEEFVFESLRAGACGYIIKKAVPEELIAAIHAVSQGYSYFSPEISRIVRDRLVITPPPKSETTLQQVLNEREREVLQLVAEGRSSREIAGMLFLSVKTVESHRSNIMKKLDLHSVRELIKYAISQGIIQV